MNVPLSKFHEQENGKWSPHVLLNLYVSDATEKERRVIPKWRVMLRSAGAMNVEQFGADDFVQHVLKSVLLKAMRTGFTKFLLSPCKVFPFPLQNVYSTDPSIDNIYFVQRNQPRLYISESAVKFWNKRVEQKAEYLQNIKRYRIRVVVLHAFGTHLLPMIISLKISRKTVVFANRKRPLLLKANAECKILKRYRIQIGSVSRLIRICRSWIIFLTNLP